MTDDRNVVNLEIRCISLSTWLAGEEFKDVNSETWYTCQKEKGLYWIVYDINYTYQIVMNGKIAEMMNFLETSD